MAGQQSHLPDLMRAASAILGLGATTTSAWLETTWETFPTTWETFSTTLELVTEPAGLAMESEWMKLELFKNGGQAGHNEIVYIHNNHTCCTIMYIYSVYIRSTGILYIYYWYILYMKIDSTLCLLPICDAVLDPWRTSNEGVNLNLSRSRPAILQEP